MSIKNRWDTDWARLGGWTADPLASAVFGDDPASRIADLEKENAELRATVELDAILLADLMRDTNHQQQVAVQGDMGRISRSIEILYEQLMAAPLAVEPAKAAGSGETIAPSHSPLPSNYAAKFDRYSLARLMVE